MGVEGVRESGERAGSLQVVRVERRDVGGRGSRDAGHPGCGQPGVVLPNHPHAAGRHVGQHPERVGIVGAVVDDHEFDRLRLVDRVERLAQGRPVVEAGDNDRNAGGGHEPSLATRAEAIREYRGRDRCRPAAP